MTRSSLLAGGINIILQRGQQKINIFLFLLPFAGFPITPPINLILVHCFVAQFVVISTKHSVDRGALGGAGATFILAGVAVIVGRSHDFVEIGEVRRGGVLFLNFSELRIWSAFLQKKISWVISLDITVLVVIVE